MLRILLYAAAVCLFAGPIAAWVYLVALGCAYQTGSSDCGFQLSDFWDSEFVVIAAVPWLLAGLCLFFGLKRR